MPVPLCHSRAQAQCRCPCATRDPQLGAAGPLTRDVLEGCVGAVALALAVVMAGSGHLETFKLLRGGG